MSTRDMSAVWISNFEFLIRAGLGAVYTVIVSIATSANDIERMVRLLPLNCQVLPDELRLLKEFWREFCEGKTCMTRRNIPEHQRLCVEDSQHTQFLLVHPCLVSDTFCKYYLWKLSEFIHPIPHSWLDSRNILQSKGFTFGAKGVFFGSTIDIYFWSRASGPGVWLEIEFGAGQALNEPMLRWFNHNRQKHSMLTRQQTNIYIKIPCDEELLDPRTPLLSEVSASFFPDISRALQDLDIPITDLKIDCKQCHNMVEFDCPEPSCDNGKFGGLDLMTTYGNCNTCGGHSKIPCCVCKDHRD
jgi:hypothetical protein